MIAKLQKPFLTTFLVGLLSSSLWANEQISKIEAEQIEETSEASSVINEEKILPVDTSPAYPELTATYRAEWRGGWFPIGIEAKRTLRHHSDGTSSFIFGADATIGALEEKSIIRWQSK